MTVIQRHTHFVSFNLSLSTQMESLNPFLPVALPLRRIILFSSGSLPGEPFIPIFKTGSRFDQVLLSSGAFPGMESDIIGQLFLFLHI